MIEQAPARGFGRFGRGKKPNAAAAKPNGAGAKTDGAASAAKPAAGARKKKGAASEKSAGAERATAVAKPAASGKSTAKPTKTRPSAPRPKGVANIVRKGRSAVAKAHARKTSARTETAGKNPPKRARGGR